MSYETEEMFKEEQLKEAEAVSAENRKRTVSTLEKTKPFKDLITGKEKEWELVKEKVALHMYQLPMAGNEVITKDFLAGCRFFSELVDGFINQFDSAFAELGKE